MDSKSMCFEFNKIVKIPDEIEKMENLTTLRVRSEKITSFDTIIPSLKHLYLISNLELKIISDRIGEMENIEMIVIENSKMLTELPNSLYKLSKLKSLTIRNCGLEQISPLISNLKNLEYLSLSQNNIKYIPLEVFDLPKLKRIYLNCNNVTSFDFSFVEKTKTLEYFDISKNMIDTYPTIESYNARRSIYF